jgi:competence protein ComEA
LLAILVLGAGLGLRVAHDRSSSRRMARPAPRLVVDPNTAPSYVLQALPQIGPALGSRIAEQRALRPFDSVQDLRKRVRGLGPATLARLAPHLRIPSAKKINVGVERTAPTSTTTVLPRIARVTLPKP